MQTLSSLQSFSVPAQLPSEHTSSTVQGSPSAQSLLFGTFEQMSSLQLSSVQLLPSSQLLPVPLQLPPVQTSLSVQLLPSSQPALLFALTQLPF